MKVSERILSSVGATLLPSVAHKLLRRSPLGTAALALFGAWLWYKRSAATARVKGTLEKAMLNPASIFNRPDDVVANSTLSRQQKIEILKRWEDDARALEVAEEEGMPGSQPKLLQPIRTALHSLNYWPDPEQSGPTKS